MFDFQSGAGRADRVEIQVCLQRMTEVECLIFRVEQAEQAGTTQHDGAGSHTGRPLQPGWTGGGELIGCLTLPN